MINHYHFETIDSTSSYIKKNYKDLDDFTFVSATHQTNGHGRYNRTWHSKKGENLLFSLLIKDKQTITKYSSISLSIAVMIFNILKSLNIDNVSIKWPNDVYVKDKKICGILLESISYNNEIEALVIGIGINVNASTFDESIIDTATSIFLETKDLIDINVLKEKIFTQTIETIKNIEFDTNYLKTARDNNYLKNKSVFATINNEAVLVKVIDINEDNSLKVIANNKELNLYSGELTFNKK